MNDAIFAIGDVHGQYRYLVQALDWIAADPEAGAPIVFIGDYIDRGPDSRAVVERLMRGAPEDTDWICLQGNHDTLLPLFVSEAEDDATQTIARRWLSKAMGGMQTLASYGIDPNADRPLDDIRTEARDRVPVDHVMWLDARPRMHVTDAHVFVHAGIRPGIALDDQDPEDLIWIRRDFLDDPRDHGRLVIHGHTPADIPEHCGNRINVDGGAGYGRPIYPVLLLRGEAFLIGPRGRAAL
ncbi:metallophosphoesterase [Thalassococcus sp. CAU 1522]|uniref:Metallophosphoesterase n=1 Tax=Thalassococcus arenae TaxID=2851652 RepID=A0ABS6N6Q9_9RHOB|nr:metallophosphoesterase [Thalassococcus arenae]MBV2359706.1 metallophosphoesterase [Thalassococcus arenae]